MTLWLPKRTLVVVRPEYTDAQKNVLEREAKLMLRRMYPPSAIKIKSKIIYWSIRLGVSALMGGLATAIIILLSM